MEFLILFVSANFQKASGSKISKFIFIEIKKNDIKKQTKEYCKKL